ncbi:ISL3 family transposase [Sphingomonas sp.]|uniref:ISL3 family transposase n=1 Tax=Sphingomonas sp. TaxID=28214 RepID=UPI003B00729F
MAEKFRSSSLVPDGFAVRDVHADGAAVMITVRSTQRGATCPVCGVEARRVHSRYVRNLADLPISGRAVRLQVDARRFRCDEERCTRRIFAERTVALAPWSRRTVRLDALAHHLGLALGGRPGASLARRLVLPVSRDTLLRLVRRRGRPAFPTPRAIGIDDWAWRRNHRYGTLICDLERRRTVALLPDREPATAQAWLATQPQIEVVTRDRGGAYALAATRALPRAVQVADRWHLMANASDAFLSAARACMPEIKAVLNGTTVDPALLTAAERLRYAGYRRREADNIMVHELAAAGVPIKEIVRRTGHSRGTVRKVLRGQRDEVFRTRESSLDPYLPRLDEQWSSGVRNGAAIWRDLRNQGFRGSLRVVTEWMTRRRRTEVAVGHHITRVPSARTVARLMTAEPDALSRLQTITVAALEAGVPALVEAREVTAAFHRILRQKREGALEGWLEQARSGLLAPFANGLARDHAAVKAAIATAWSNAQAEGQITKLKLVKRQMYGRGKLDLLEARVVGST